MPLDPPSVLLRKARDDERLAALVARDPTITDEQVGFLAQQAVEKAFKAVLSHRGIHYRRTHDLSELIDLLTAAQIPLAAETEKCVVLTPFAAEMRYDYLPPEDATEERFDRAGALRLVRFMLDWAERMVITPDEVL